MPCEGAGLAEIGRSWPVAVIMDVTNTPGRGVSGGTRGISRYRYSRMYVFYSVHPSTTTVVCPWLENRGTMVGAGEGPRAPLGPSSFPHDPKGLRMEEGHQAPSPPGSLHLPTQLQNHPMDPRRRRVSVLPLISRRRPRIHNTVDSHE